AYVAQANPGFVYKFDFTNPASATQSAKATTGQGTHYISLSKDGKHVYASDYLAQAVEGAGLPPADGKVWIIDTSTMQGQAIDLAADPTISALSDGGITGWLPPMILPESGMN